MRLPRRAGPRSAAAAATVDDGRWRRQLRAGRRWAAWGALLGLSLGLLTQLPAQWLADGLSRASGGRMLLAEARGSLWNGSAALVLAGGAGSRDAAVLPGRLQWRLRPGWQGLRLVAEHACCLARPLQLRLQPAWNGYSLQLGDGPPAAGTAAEPAAVIGRWPASWLVGLGTPWNTLQLGGQLQLSSAGLRLQSVAGELRFEGALSLLLQDASSSLSTLPALGSYLLQVQGLQGLPGLPGAEGAQGAAGGGDTASLQLSTQQGALQLQGSGQWTGRGLRFRGAAQAAQGHDSALSNLLNIIGQRQGALSLLSIG